MVKYRCSVCGNVSDYLENGCCSLCGVNGKVVSFDEDYEMTPSNAIRIDKDNLGVVRLVDKCINCGVCTQTCVIREGMNFKADSELCLSCGQCIQTCPVRALIPRYEYWSFLKAKDMGKTCIAYVSPAVRVSLGEAFGRDYGSFEQKKLVGLLKLLGFDYVFDTTFAADLTVMEEASELLERVNNGGVLPMFTSCCPAWVKYAKQFYPEILNNISTCKSPIGMMGSVIDAYFLKEYNLKRDDVYKVVITPCTAKKYEIKTDDSGDTDLVLTIYELIDIIRGKNIKYEDIKDEEFSSFFSEGSGAGVIFGNTGGVMEASLRTFYYLKTKKKLDLDMLDFNEVRGIDNVKEASIEIDGTIFNVCVIHQMSSAKEILESVKNGTCKYHFIEIMNCVGGCIGGGGQPKIEIYEEVDIKEKRIKSLYDRDGNSNVRCSYDNPQIKDIYDKVLDYPLSKKAYDLLHTSHIGKK